MGAIISICIMALALATMVVDRADAAAARSCLSKDQERAVIGGEHAIKLAAAIHAVRGHPGEVISARLCHGAKGLEYVLTLLARDGKVTLATVDAENGSVIGRR